MTKYSKKKLSHKSLESRNGYSTVNNGTTAVKSRQEVPETNPLQGREKNLKEVLTNLHDEFETLNK